jgi:hypothetical protein
MRDNQPKHRQMRKEQRKLARRKGALEGLPSVLIVCEGRETEPNYIEGLCEHLGVNRAAIKVIRGESVTDPVGLVQKAQRLFKADGGHDLVYVVCDGDAPRLAEARELAQEKTLRNAAGVRARVHIVASYPSFEFWLLLHFEYSARPYMAAADATDALRRHVTDYAKNDRIIFAKVAAGLDAACENVDRLKAELAKTGSRVPDTDFRMLVDQLVRMRK